MCLKPTVGGPMVGPVSACQTKKTIHARSSAEISEASSLSRSRFKVEPIDGEYLKWNYTVCTLHVLFKAQCVASEAKPLPIPFQDILLMLNSAQNVLIDQA